MLVHEVLALGAAERDVLAAARRADLVSAASHQGIAASWLMGAHPELDGEDRVTFLRKGGDAAGVRLVAARNGQRFAQ